jgi:hypothetical protein
LGKKVFRNLNAVKAQCQMLLRLKRLRHIKLHRYRDLSQALNQQMTLLHIRFLYLSQPFAYAALILGLTHGPACNAQYGPS